MTPSSFPRSGASGISRAIQTLDQLRHLHIDPDRKRKFLQPFVDVDAVLAEATRLRRELTSPVDEDDPQRSTAGKLRLLRRADEVTAQLHLIADGIIAAGLALGGKPGAQLEDAYKALEWALAEAFPSDGSAGNHKNLDAILAKGLTPTVDTDYERWHPLHWVIEIPDVMERGGFDAIIGNPPFLGGSKISGSSGSNLREFLVNQIAGGRTGNADLVAYMFLRAYGLTREYGTLGLIATNTIAQGDTREVSLDQMVGSGFQITRSIQSRKWPSLTANLQFAAVWGSRGGVVGGVPRVADGVEVLQISSLLEPTGRVAGYPVRLRENAGIATTGCKVYGMGFVLSPDEADELLSSNGRNKDVIFPYMIGDDANSRPDISASRFVIDFKDWDLARAQSYGEPFIRVERLVKPEREQRPGAVKSIPFWHYERPRLSARESISQFAQVLVIALVSKSLMVVRVPSSRVFANTLGIFATDSYADQAVLSSVAHQYWAIKYGSGMRNDPRYTPTDVFETFPLPERTESLEAIGYALDDERSEIMLRRQLGLTSLYNLVNDPGVSKGKDADIDRIRLIHTELDSAVMAAYKWFDIELGHGFYTYRQMRRFTVSPAARVEILDRLLEENHRRAGILDEEQLGIQRELFT